MVAMEVTLDSYWKMNLFPPSHSCMSIFICKVVICFGFVFSFSGFVFFYVYAHTTLKVPDLIWSQKLSRVGPGLYLDGSPSLLISRTSLTVPLQKQEQPRWCPLLRRVGPRFIILFFYFVYVWSFLSHVWMISHFPFISSPFSPAVGILMIYKS